jgi:cytochrome c-type biogenesis protein CcmH
MMKRLIWTAWLTFILTGWLVASVSAQGSTPSDDQVNAIAKQLYCPVCENTPLDVCPTQACKEWREEIRSMLVDGKSEAEIKQHFVDYYGARVLAEPPRTGLNWLVYVVPPILIVIGAFVLFRALRSWSQSSDKASDSPEPGAGTVDEEYVERLEEELRKRN